MEEFDEDRIWDTIMESGKSRIDYAAFQGFFDFDPDNFLSSVIYGFANNKDPEAIAGHIDAQMRVRGKSLDLGSLTRFIVESRPALDAETALTAMALRELARGADPESVYGQVVAGLGSTG